MRVAHAGTHTFDGSADGNSNVDGFDGGVGIGAMRPLKNKAGGHRPDLGTTREKRAGMRLVNSAKGGPCWGPRPESGWAMVVIMGATVMTVI